MYVHYDPDADVLLVRVREAPPVDAIEEPGGVVISYGEDGEPVSVEFLNASKHQLLAADGVSVTVAATSGKPA